MNKLVVAGSVVILAIHLLSIFTFIGLKYFPVFYPNVLTICVIGFGVYLREPSPVKLLVIGVLSILVIFYLISEIIVIQNAPVSETITFEFRGIGMTVSDFQQTQILFQRISTFVVALSGILAMLLLMLVNIELPVISDDSVFLKVFILSLVLCTLLLNFFPPAFQLYPDPHLFSVWFIWVCLPLSRLKSTPLTRLNVAIGSFIAISLEVTFVVIHAVAFPPSLSFFCLEDFKYGKITYSNLSVNLSLSVNYFMHIVELLVLVTVFTLILCNNK